MSRWQHRKARAFLDADWQAILFALAAIVMVIALLVIYFRQNFQPDWQGMIVYGIRG
jgi:uncharacterized membrane protein HdeD (DUF308 family)